MTFSVLFVCTGNVCRSPAAELLFRFASGTRAGATSAGLDALDGAPVDAPTAEVLARMGIATTHHRARQLSVPMVDGADLVLTAEVTQRDEVMRMAPSAFQRTFTLREFCRAAAEVRLRHPQFDRPDQIAAVAVRYRGIAGQTVAGRDDVADAYRAPPAEAQRMVGEVASLIDELVRILGVPRPRPHAGRPSPTGVRHRV